MQCFNAVSLTILILLSKLNSNEGDWLANSIFYLVGYLLANSRNHEMCRVFFCAFWSKGISRSYKIKPGNSQTLRAALNWIILVSADLLFQSLPANGCVHSEFEDEAVIWESRMSPVAIPKARVQSVQWNKPALTLKQNKPQIFSKLS